MSAERTETRSQATGESGRDGRPAQREPDAPLISDWLEIQPDSTVVIFTGKVEVGQNIRTSLAQAVADELCLTLDSIQLVMADTDRTPYDMGTVGSRSTPIMSPQLRKVAAATRELLIDRAAARWHVSRSELTMERGEVLHPRTRRTTSIGDLAGGQPFAQPYGDNAPVTPADAWTVAGASHPKVDGRAIVTGARQYTPDLVRPGMGFGKILRAPAFGATLVALDTRAAEALPQVTVVNDAGVIGVVAPDRYTAQRSLDALHATWTCTPQIGQDELFAYLRAHLAPPPEPGRASSEQRDAAGSLAEGRAAAAHTHQATYTNAYIAHAPLEPRAAVAEWNNGKLTVWTGTQRPFGVRTELAQAFGLDETQVRVIVPDTGAAYGGKHTGEVAIEAARLAKAAARPVKLIWTREEEFTWAYFRPAGVMDITSGVDDNGNLTAWEFHNYNAGPSGMQVLYDVPNYYVAYHPTLAPLRQGSYRALAATANTFARETHIDELAHMLDRDPLAFRLQNLRNPRFRAVFEAVAARFGWGRTPPTGRGFGIAGGSEKGSYVATCVEVAVDRVSGQVRVVRVVQAFECGAIVNPDGVRNQVEGAIIQGLGAALFEAVAFADGRVQTNHFADYRVPRFADIPVIDVVLLDRKDLPSAGAGETPIIGVAPAVGNAIFAATGVRLRSLPLVPEGIVPEKSRQ